MITAIRFNIYCCTLFLQQLTEHGGLHVVLHWHPLIVCQIVFATATAAMPGQ